MSEWWVVTSYGHSGPYPTRRKAQEAAVDLGGWAHPGTPIVERWRIEPKGYDLAIHHRPRAQFESEDRCFSRQRAGR